MTRLSFFMEGPPPLCFALLARAKQSEAAGGLMRAYLFFFFLPPLTSLAHATSPCLSRKYRYPSFLSTPTLATFLALPPFLLPRAIKAQDTSPFLSMKWRYP